ncbi:MAG: hypothetical protein EOL86_12610 [Deltaproteobacteria bacterium]|nr:hypothetical protein [Deltaproteobacteria bacterium]
MHGVFLRVHVALGNGQSLFDSVQNSDPPQTGHAILDQLVVHAPRHSRLQFTKNAHVPRVANPKIAAYGQLIALLEKWAAWLSRIHLCGRGPIPATALDHFSMKRTATMVVLIRIKTRQAPQPAGLNFSPYQ